MKKYIVIILMVCSLFELSCDSKKSLPSSSGDRLHDHSRNSYPHQGNVMNEEPIDFGNDFKAEQDDKHLNHLASIIRLSQNRSLDGSAIIAMHQLMDRWSPVGKKSDVIKSLIGPPSFEDNNNMVYRLSDGDQVYEWVMIKNGDLISDITKNINE